MTMYLGPKHSKCFQQRFSNASGNRPCPSAMNRMFSPELPLDVQRFSAVWLIWILSQNRRALSFGDTERLTASLCDRAIPRGIPSGDYGKASNFREAAGVGEFCKFNADGSCKSH